MPVLAIDSTTSADGRASPTSCKTRSRESRSSQTAAEKAGSAAIRRKTSGGPKRLQIEAAVCVTGPARMPAHPSPVETRLACLEKRLRRPQSPYRREHRATTIRLLLHRRDLIHLPLLRDNRSEPTGRHVRAARIFERDGETAGEISNPLRTRRAPRRPSPERPSPAAGAASIRRTLQRYKAAVEGRNIESLKSLWPTISRDTERTFQDRIRRLHAPSRSKWILPTSMPDSLCGAVRRRLL